MKQGFATERVIRAVPGQGTQAKTGGTGKIEAVTDSRFGRSSVKLNCIIKKSIQPTDIKHNKHAHIWMAFSTLSTHIMQLSPARVCGEKHHAPGKKSLHEGIAG